MPRGRPPAHEVCAVGAVPRWRILLGMSVFLSRQTPRGPVPSWDSRRVRPTAQCWLPPALPSSPALPRAGLASSERRARRAVPGERVLSAR